MLFGFKKVDSLLCSYCHEKEETPFHLFHSCLKTKQYGNIRQYLSQFINIAHSTSQSSTVGIYNNQHLMLINELLLTLKFYIYSARNTKQLNFDNLKKTIKKSKELEKELTNSIKLKLLKKWRTNDHIIDWYFFQSENGESGGRLISFLIYLWFFSLFSFYLFFCNVHL